MPLPCLVGEITLGFIISSSSLFENSHKHWPWDNPHRQGKLVKEGIDGCSEENWIFSGPPPKSKGVTSSWEKKESLQCHRTMSSAYV